MIKSLLGTKFSRLRFHLMPTVLPRPAARRAATVICLLNFATWLGHDELLNLELRVRELPLERSGSEQLIFT